MSPSAATERFTNRPYFVLALPLLAAVEVLRVEQVVIVIDRFHIDFGAFCFAKRSGEPRRPGRPRGVVLSSLIANRRPQIRTAIEVLSSMMSDGAMRPRTVDQRARFFKAFMDWAATFRLVPHMRNFRLLLSMPTYAISRSQNTLT